MNHIVLSLFYFITALPGNILGWPIYVHSKLYSLYMQRKALKKSNVKIQAIDVVASNKVYIYNICLHHQPSWLVDSKFVLFCCSLSPIFCWSTSWTQRRRPEQSASFMIIWRLCWLFLGLSITVLLWPIVYLCELVAMNTRLFWESFQKFCLLDSQDSFLRSMYS